MRCPYVRPDHCLRNLPRVRVKSTSASVTSFCFHRNAVVMLHIGRLRYDRFRPTSLFFVKNVLFGDVNVILGLSSDLDEYRPRMLAQKFLNPKSAHDDRSGHCSGMLFVSVTSNTWALLSFTASLFNGSTHNCLSPLRITHFLAATSGIHLSSSSSCTK